MRTTRWTIDDSSFHLMVEMMVNTLLLRWWIYSIYVWFRTMFSINQHHLMEYIIYFSLPFEFYQWWWPQIDFMNWLFDWVNNQLIDRLIDRLIETGLTCPSVPHNYYTGARSHHLSPSAPVNFISLVTSSVRLQEEEPQTAFPMSFTWASHIATNGLTGY